MQRVVRKLNVKVRFLVFVVLKLVTSCRWNCDLGKLSTILEMKILRRQLEMHVFGVIVKL
jgi:hypothetical protein